MQSASPAAAKPSNPRSAPTARASTVGAALTALFVVVYLAVGKGHLDSVATQAALVAVIAGAAVWALMTLASRRLPRAKSLTLVVVLAVAVATLAPAGLARYAYGDQGSLVLEVSVVDGSVAWGADRNDTFEVGIALSNIGSTVIRVVPYEFWDYRMTDPNGSVLPWAGPVASRTPFSDPATEEIAPGARLNRGLQATFNWPGGSGRSAGGYWDATIPGNYTLTVSYQSGGSGEYVSLPLYTTRVTSKPVTIQLA